MDGQNRNVISSNPTGPDIHKNQEYVMRGRGEWKKDELQLSSEP